MKPQELERKLELEKELGHLQRLADQQAKDAQDKKQYERFVYRPSCAVTGKAHACDTLDTLGISVHIPGNSGERYTGPMVTSSTRTYFHNVWTHQQRLNFANRLNKFILDEINEVIDHPVMRLEIMGLQANEYHIKGLPKDITDRMREDIEKEQFKVLDGVDVSRVGDTRLAHSAWILSAYNKHRSALRIEADAKRAPKGRHPRKAGPVAKRRGTPKQNKR